MQTRAKTHKTIEDKKQTQKTKIMLMITVTMMKIRRRIRKNRHKAMKVMKEM
jgi:hypothetical protein